MNDRLFHDWLQEHTRHNPRPLFDGRFIDTRSYQSCIPAISEG